uniref:Calcium binding protein 39-like n=1 Tax=Periophthalmus magnuspinnatus TaxID=409849 RepID=A0A3B4BDY3_9GOBI
MPLFGKSHKSPSEIVKILKENLNILVKQEKKADKVSCRPGVDLASEEVSKCLVSMKEILYGSNDKEPHTETVAQLAQELYTSGLLLSLVEHLQLIDFEVLLRILLKVLLTLLQSLQFVSRSCDHLMFM